jgi:hypothetical protein
MHGLERGHVIRRWRGKSFLIPEGVKVPEGLTKGDRVAAIVKHGTLEHLISGRFPFFLPEPSATA